MIITTMIIASLIAARKQIIHIFSNIDYVLLSSIMIILIVLSAFIYYSVMLVLSSIMISL